MDLVVTHLSSLSGDRVCAAGWCPSEQRFVRLKAGPNAWDFPSRSQLVWHRRPIRPGDVIAFEHRPLAPRGPHSENVWFREHTLEVARTLDVDDYRSVLERCAAASLAEGLGGKPEQRSAGRSCKMVGADRSLCVRKLDAPPTFELDETAGGRVRTRWSSDGLSIRSLVDWVGFPGESSDEFLGVAVRELTDTVAGAGSVYFACSLALPVEGDSYWLVVAGVESFA